MDIKTGRFVKKIFAELIIVLTFLIFIFPGACTEKKAKVNSQIKETIKSSTLLRGPGWIGDEPFVIDVNIGLGRFANGNGADFIQTDKTLEHLRSAGINGSLVYSVLSRETDAEEGNSIVLEECARHPELIPGYVITPFETDIDSAIALMQKHDIRVVRLFPVSGHFSVYPSIIGPVVEKLQNANKVLFIDFEANHWSSTAIDYDAIYMLCRAYPKIPIVLIGSTITGAVNYPNLLEECNNLYLEISQIIQPEGIQQLVKKGFGKKLIFGSGFPVLEPSALLYMLKYTGLTRDELHDICSRNFLRLMNIKSDNDSFMLVPPAKREAIDLHVHLGTTLISPAGTENAEGIIRNMDRCDIKACMVTSVWACAGEVKRGNKAVSEACAKYPDRLFGYLTLDPKYPEEVQSEIALYGNNPSFHGIKLHAMHEVDLTDQRHKLIFSFADNKGWFLLCHSGKDPVKWEKICNTYKNAKFIVAHAGVQDPRNQDILRLAEVAKRCKNLYFDCASSIMTPGALERFVAVAGADHLTYGSDFPMFDFAYETGRILCSSLRDDEKNLILYGNAKKLMGL